MDDVPHTSYIDGHSPAFTTLWNTIATDFEANPGLEPGRKVVKESVKSILDAAKLNLLDDDEKGGLCLKMARMRPEFSGFLKKELEASGITDKDRLKELFIGQTSKIENIDSPA